MSENLAVAKTDVDRIHDVLESLGSVDDQIDDLKAKMDVLRGERNELEQEALELFESIPGGEPFQHGEYTVRVKQGRESVRIDDAECWRIIPDLPQGVQALTMEQRWHIADQKTFKTLFQAGKLQAAEKVIKDFGIVVVKPAEDKVVVERKK